MKNNKIMKHGSHCKEECLAGSLYCYAICSYFNGTDGNYNPMPSIKCCDEEVRPKRY